MLILNIEVRRNQFYPVNLNPMGYSAQIEVLSQNLSRKMLTRKSLTLREYICGGKRDKILAS